MDNPLEHDIRDIAYDFWLNAGTDFSRTALDFWLMAEQMVVELTADSARRAKVAAATALGNTAAWPSALRALYLYRVRELAHNMWSASTEQRDRSMDFWLAAEKHVRLLMESAARTASARFGGDQDTLVRTFETFSATNHLEQIRKTAYQLWEAAGRQYGSALDFWLAAERKTLDTLTTSEPPPTAPASEAAPQPERPKRSPKPRQRPPLEK